MVVSHQFITLTISICVQHGGREAPCRAGLSVAVETCYCWAAASAQMWPVDAAVARSVVYVSVCVG